MEYVLKRGGRSAIYSAILKYGLDNFSIEILESHLSLFYFRRSSIKNKKEKDINAKYIIYFGVNLLNV
jgi:hypothetical protein